MASKAQENKRPVPKKPRFNDVRFINWTLTDEQKQLVKGWLEGIENYDELASKLIQSDYKVTVSWDKYRSCFTASVIPQGDTHRNAGYILTGKGSTPLKAVRQAGYIHYVIFDEDWAAYSTETGIEDIDD